MRPINSTAYQMFFSRKNSQLQAEADARCRELRRTMQDIVIAHAATCFKHMNAEQLAAAQADWARVVQGRGWMPFFTDDGPLPAAPNIETSPQGAGPQSADCKAASSSLQTRIE